MPRTPTTESVRQAKRATGVLRPLLEDLFRKPLEIEDDEDIDFMVGLIESRARPRKKYIYSPSMLSSCIRQVYFAKTGQVKKPSQSKRVHGYFLDGTFRHFKWQFALWKLHRAGKITLLGCEVFVRSSNGDWGGTFDALVRINGVLYIVDFKGANANSFLFMLSHGASEQYRIQVVGYGIIASSALSFGKIRHCLIIYEAKNGPAQVRNASPIAIHEELVLVGKYQKTVVSRLEKLRDYETRKEIPPPECESTSSTRFLECPYCWYCRGEVERIEKENKATSGNTAKPRAALSRKSRVGRSRRRGTAR